MIWGFAKETILKCDLRKGRWAGCSTILNQSDQAMGFAWRSTYNAAKSDLLLFTEIRKMLNPDQDLTAFIENPDFIIQQALPFSPGNAALHTSGGQPRAARPGLVGLFIVEGHYKEFGLSSLSSGMRSPAHETQSRRKRMGNDR